MCTKTAKLCKNMMSKINMLNDDTMLQQTLYPGLSKCGLSDSFLEQLVYTIVSK